MEVPDPRRSKLRRMLAASTSDPVWPVTSCRSLAPSESTTHARGFRGLEVVPLHRHPVGRLRGESRLQGAPQVACPGCGGFIRGIRERLEDSAVDDSAGALARSPCSAKIRVARRRDGVARRVGGEDEVGAGSLLKERTEVEHGAPAEGYQPSRRVQSGVTLGYTGRRCAACIPEDRRPYACCVRAAPYRYNRGTRGGYRGGAWPCGPPLSQTR